MTPRHHSTMSNVSLQESLSLATILLRSKKKLFHILHGEHDTVFGGRGMVFKEVREYSSEDDIRHLNWKITARTGTPMVNLYNETKQIPVVLVYLNSGGLYFGAKKSKREIAIEILTSLSFITLNQYDTLHTLFHSASQHQWLAPSRHKGAVSLTFDAACSLEPLGQHIDFDSLVAQLLQKLKRKSLIFLIGDFWEFEEKHDLGRLAFSHELYCIIIRDHAEEEITLNGSYAITDPLNSKTHTLHIDKQTVTGYRALIQEHESMLKKHFAQHHIASTKIYTDEDAIEKLAQFVRR